MPRYTQPRSLRAWQGRAHPTKNSSSRRSSTRRPVREAPLKVVHRGELPSRLGNQVDWVQQADAPRKVSVDTRRAQRKATLTRISERWHSPGYRSQTKRLDYTMLAAKHLTMPTGPEGQKRPKDVASNAVHVMRIATGEIADPASSDRVVEGTTAAAALSRLGGIARTEKYSAKRLKEIAKMGAMAGWGRGKTK